MKEQQVQGDAGETSVGGAADHAEGQAIALPAGRKEPLAKQMRRRGLLAAAVAAVAGLVAKQTVRPAEAAATALLYPALVADGIITNTALNQTNLYAGITFSVNKPVFRVDATAATGAGPPFTVNAIEANGGGSGNGVTASGGAGGLGVSANGGAGIGGGTGGTGVSGGGGAAPGAGSAGDGVFGVGGVSASGQAGFGVRALGGTGIGGGNGAAGVSGIGGNAPGAGSGGAGVVGVGGSSVSGTAGTGVFGEGGDDNGFGGVGVVGEGGTGIGNGGGGFGVFGTGGSASGAGLGGMGVFGSSGTSFGGGPSGDAVHGQGLGSGNGVVGTTTTGIGVQGQAQTNATGIGVRGLNGNNGTGIKGVSNTGFSLGADGDGSGTGVQGKSNSGNGVLGQSNSGYGTAGISTSNVGIYGSAGTGAGVYGTASSYVGVYGNSTGAATGVFGASTNGVGGYFQSANNIGLEGVSMTPNVPAGYFVSTVAAGPTRRAAQFDGDVLINGSYTATGLKSAAVPHLDGTLRKLYSLESPESFFEDFGKAAVEKGVATVALDPDFAVLVQTGEYSVFLTPNGDCRGLYVNVMGPQGFEVRELQGGTSSLPFSYRIVAKRRDVVAPRLEKLERERVKAFALKQYAAPAAPTIPPEQVYPEQRLPRPGVPQPPPSQPPTQPGVPQVPPIAPQVPPGRR